MSKADELSKAFGFLKWDEVELLKKIAKDLPENAVCINIGAGVGTSALTVIELRPDLAKSFYTLDISPSSPIGGLENERNAFVNSGMFALLPIQVLGDSKALAHDPRFENMQVDYVFVDGEHNYEGITGDIDGWLPKLKLGGVMLFHDYREGVWQSVFETVNKRMDDQKVVGLANTLIAFRIVSKNE